MPEVLRLLRISLLLRLVPSLVAIIGVVVTGNTFVVPVLAVSAMVSVLLLSIVWPAQRLGWTTHGHVRALLIIAVFIYGLENLLPLAAWRLGWFGDLIGAGFGGRLSGQASGRAPGPGTVSLFFTVIPAVLGAWLEGRRRVVAWIALAIGVNVLSTVSLFGMLSSQLPADSVPEGIGLLVAQGIVIAVVCYFVSVLADRQRAEHALLEQANTQLAAQAHVREQLAASRERMNLSRELHDTVAHALAALSIQLNAVEAVLNTPGAAKQQLATARTLVRDGLEDTRRAITGLRADSVRDLGLAEALRKHIDSVTRRSGLTITFECDSDETALADDYADGLYRIAQEALNNAEKHSGAKSVIVRLQRRADAVVVSVQDDGVGFDVAALEVDRYGLRGMRERAELIGAHLTVKSVVGAGTTVSAVCPIPAGEALSSRHG